MFKFSDNAVDMSQGNKEYGTIMFVEFEQGVRKTEDCTADCSDQKYFLKARHFVSLSKTYFKILDEGIVTSMRLFYKNIVFHLEGKT